MSDDTGTPERRKTDQRETLLQAAADLQKATEDLTAKFEGVNTFSRETRRIASEAERNGRRIRMVVAVLALVIVALAITTLRANHANDKATRLAEYQVASCEAANEARAAQRQQWLDARNLLNALGGREVRGFADDLVANANRNFPPLDCRALVRGGEPQPASP